MQDNAPCHVDRTCQKWFKDNRIQVLEWPGNSCDLNLIKNLRQTVKCEVQKRKPSNLQELKTIFTNVWVNEMTPEKCRPIVEGMPARIAEVIKNKGDVTR